MPKSQSTASFCSRMLSQTVADHVFGTRTHIWWCGVYWLRFTKRCKLNNGLCILSELANQNSRDYVVLFIATEVTPITHLNPHPRPALPPDPCQPYMPTPPYPIDSYQYSMRRTTWSYRFPFNGQSDDLSKFLVTRFYQEKIFVFILISVTSPWVQYPQQQLSRNLLLWEKD